MKTVQLEFRGRSPIELLQECEGHYECPIDESGKPIGPIVGYVGKYEDKKQYVGFRYVNFAKAERHGPVLKHFARILQIMLETGPHRRVNSEAVGFCGAPEGGKALASALAGYSRKQYIYPEKVVTKLASDSGREESKLIFDRHEPDPGELWWIVEDVCNNFSTTANLVKLIEDCGARVAGVVCFWNRSETVNDTFTVREGLSIPVISIVREIIPQYRQDDPRVAPHIAVGDVVWKPKKREEWPKLVAAMKR